MSDLDFTILDANSIDLPVRNRKPKYVTKPWEYKNASEEYTYYKMLQRSYKRRHGDIETPYDHHIDQRVDYAKEMETVFPIQLHNIQEVMKNNSEKAETSYCYICCEYKNVEDISSDNSDCCSECFDESFTCTFCNEIMSNEYLYSECGDLFLCLDCSDNEEKVSCDYCCEIVDISNSIVLDHYDNKKTYCLSCLPEIERYRNDNS